MNFVFFAVKNILKPTIISIASIDLYEMYFL